MNPRVFRGGVVKPPKTEHTDEMIDEQNFLDIISGRRKGIPAIALRTLLGLLTPVYRIVVAIRNFRFDRAAINPDSSASGTNRHSDNRLIKTADIPVISVGNLTTGGTGKTPFVIWLARFIRSRNLRVAIVSRGYGASMESGASRNDEALELENRLPDVPHLQSPDRYEMCRIATEELESQIVILDDGFQHRRLHRDLDIVLIDCTNPYGFGRLLPRGLLREPISSIRRADAVVLTRSELISEQEREKLQQQIKSLHPKATIGVVRTLPSRWQQFDGTETKLNSLIGRNLFAFCGIGNPLSFVKTLEGLDLNLAGKRFFADHHNFSREDLEQICSDAKSFGANALVCTHKDLVKIGCNQWMGMPIYALITETEFVFNEESIGRMIESVLDTMPFN